ncbi:A24 family peptidase [Nocardioides sp. GY 10127]|uniref:prepilin peptidase n=1 Tax=Nocardioides sp. GY 10127 TaxID=2569762 RepID=UPI0010A8E66B|nr:A24 family peptidase [Nocardioides sp. GY 10127]TIC78917.1 prepilin peptidase [Nocardioides sp. GY 10127]
MTTLDPLPSLVPLAALLAGLLGLAMGSFGTVVAHRVPAGRSVVRPRSACPACGHEVRERDNVPVLSWVLLHGRCRDCAAPIPWRYPALEAGTAVLFVLLVVALLPALPTPWDAGRLLAWLAVVAGGVPLVAVDLAEHRLPFAVTGWTAVFVTAGLVGGALAEGDRALLADPLAGAAAWFIVVGGLHVLTRGRGMGLGDVALAPVLGAAAGSLGVGAALVGLAGAFVAGALVGTALIVAGRARRRPAPRMLPFGPFLVGAALLAVPCGQPLADAYLRLVGL